MTETAQLTRPLLRGVIHGAAFPASLAVGALLIAYADGSAHQLAASVFAASVAACFGISALYHRVTWTPELRLRMRRLDHAGIYLLIAGTYTPVALLSLGGAWRSTILAVVWTGAVGAIVQPLVWPRAPRWVAAAIGLAMGWTAVAALPEIVPRVGAAGSTLLLAGGVLYTIGAIVYVRRRPSLVPHVFGYHELFHALTIVAVACQYTAIAFFVIRVG